MSIFDILKRKKEEDIKEEMINSKIKDKEEELIISKDEPILTIEKDGFINTNSKEAIAKYKHNLQKLYKELKQTNEINKFALIRDEDHFPYDNKWLVNSKDTIIEKTSLALSKALKEQYALEKENLYKTYGNITIPPNKEKMNEAINKLPKDFAAVYTPVHFRSSKHFTINTPLSITGNYNSVSDNRNFTIIDDITNFLKSPYIYSVAAHDAYLDVCHEPLDISDKAIILINKNKYEQLKKNEKIMNELKNKKVIIYEGEEYLAISMILTELGIIPSKVGKNFIDDEENLIAKATENALKKIADEKGIYYDQSHGGKIKDNSGHFSSYFDDKNNDYSKSLISLVNFLEEKIGKTISVGMLTDERKAQSLISEIGTKKLIEAINEYNEKVKEEHKIRRKKYLENRKKITPEISELFIKTTKAIDIFYKEKLFENYSSKELEELEENFRLFFQSSTIEEQLQKASNILTNIQRKKNIQEMLEESKQESDVKKKTNNL